MVLLHKFWLTRKCVSSCIFFGNSSKQCGLFWTFWREPSRIESFQEGSNILFLHPEAILCAPLSNAHQCNGPSAAIARPTWGCAWQSHIQCSLMTKNRTFSGSSPFGDFRPIFLEAFPPSDCRVDTGFRKISMSWFRKATSFSNFHRSLQPRTMSAYSYFQKGHPVILSEKILPHEGTL